ASPAASAGANGNAPQGPPAPLTGLPTVSAATSAQRAIALALSGSDPHGLTAADVIYQEFAAPVRYIAVFQSKQATGVGPLTGTQPTDGQALSVLHPLFGYDGGTRVFTKVLDHTSVTDLGRGTHPSLYARAPHGVTASTKAVLRAGHGSGAPPQIFYFRGADTGRGTLATTGESRASAARVSIPGYGTESWSFDSHTGLWTLTGGGPRVQVANVVVQTVRYKHAVVSHRAGTTVPSARLIGKGSAEVLSGSAGGSGMAAAGTWSKPHLDQLTNYFDNNGYPMAFQPGPTWVAFAPKGTRVSASAGQ
ncbi:MAG: DUF3048 C-terminal domain-containing protein, partial [Actinobacteria bacterium]|nr:DUF3048 C-terminal domain-containing protein [Actinomycetota bacterium]